MLIILSNVFIIGFILVTYILLERRTNSFIDSQGSIMDYILRKEHLLLEQINSIFYRFSYTSLFVYSIFFLQLNTNYKILYVILVLLNIINIKYVVT